MNETLRKSRLHTLVVVCCIAGAWMSSSLSAQVTDTVEDRTKFWATFPADSLPVGATAQWSVHADGEVSWQWTPGSLAHFLVLSGDTAVSEAGERTYNFELMALDTGRFQLPSLSARGPEVHYRIPPQPVHVILIAEQEGVAVAEARSTRDVPFHLAWWLEAYGGHVLGWLLALVALALLVRYWWIKRNKDAVPTPPLAPVVDPYSAALARLAELRETAPWQYDVKAFYIDLGDLVRLYLEGRSGLPLAEMTTDEAIAHVQNRWTGTQIEQYRFILTRADMVKFAKGTLDVSDHLSCLDQAEQLVKAFKPQQEHDGVVGA